MPGKKLSKEQERSRKIVMHYTGALMKNLSKSFIKIAAKHGEEEASGVILSIAENMISIRDNLLDVLELDGFDVSYFGVYSMEADKE